jgi:hypothetical protein
MAEQMVLAVVAITLLGGAIVGDLLDDARRRSDEGSDQDGDPDRDW